MNNKVKDAVKNTIIILCGVIEFICFTRYGLGIGTWRGNDFELYREKMHSGGHYHLNELPPGAKDFRFKCTNLGMGAHSYAAFTLEGKAYEDYIASVSNEKKSDNPYAYGADFVGKKVSDTFDSYNEYGEYIGFPTTISDYVIDDNIKDYTIIYFYTYLSAGSELNAVAANPDTGRVVIVDSVVR